MGYFDLDKGGGGGREPELDARGDRSQALRIFYDNTPISSQHVSRLLIIQKMHRLGLVDWDPLGDIDFITKINGYTDFGDVRNTEARWAEAWENFNPEGIALLETLRRLEIYKIELRLLDRFERAALSKVAAVVEADRVARNKYKRAWAAQQRKNYWTNRCRWRNRERKKIEAELMAKQKNEKAGSDPTEAEIERSQEQIREVLGPEAEALERPDAADYADGSEATRALAERALVNALESGAPEKPKAPEPRPEVELEIVRVGPNPRILQCKYKLLADEIKIHLWVKTNRNFVRGMKLKMAEQDGADWHWEGILPRFRGRW
jgi:hypothetical protein